MSKTFNVMDYDIIYLSYDEPNCEENYYDLLQKVPWAKRVHGVEGSDAAHKACAKLSTTDRFITIDGDNKVSKNFINEKLVFNDDVDLENCVISWSGYNIINGLTYGNGGIKCWPKDIVLNMRTHENADPNNVAAQVDFCWDLTYLQINKTYSNVYNNATPQQAWRAGFREGVKMSLREGEKVDPKKFNELIPAKNLDRLKIWCTTGADVENGLWAIYGAREGCYKTNCTDWDHVNVRDFEYLNDLWNNKYSKIPEDQLRYEIMGIGETLRYELDLNIPVYHYDDEQSKFFKSVYTPPTRMAQNFLRVDDSVDNLYDIVMISYNEPNAEENYTNLKKRFPRAKRIHGVKGIHQAHIEAAKICDTDLIWIVDGDAVIDENFDFTYTSPENEKHYVKVWRSKNPVNGLEYGYGGIKLFPRQATIDMDTSKPDMTTSISRHFKPIKVVSNETSFNTDPFGAWKSGFRECCKLASKVIDRQKNDETEERLYIWQTVGEDKPFGNYAMQGAKAGAQYGKDNQGNLDALKKINDFEWLEEQFKLHTGEDAQIETPTAPVIDPLDEDIVNILDRFETLYGGNIEHVRRFYNDKEITSLFKLDENEELRKAVVEKNIHSIFRVADADEELRKAIIEKNLHSIFRVINANEDFRKAIVEDNLHSIFRLLNCNEDFRKAVMDDNLYSLKRLMPNIEDVFKLLGNDKWALWRLLENYTNSSYVKPLKKLYADEIDFDKDCLSKGQLLSKKWLVEELAKIDRNLGTIFLCAGWYGTVIPLFVDFGIKFDKVRSFDIDDNVWKIAEVFNKDLLLDGWKFKAQTQDIFDINYSEHTYQTIKGNGDVETAQDSPNTIINTSCEHIENFEEWYDKIPEGKLVILQSNDFTEVEEHVNCVKDTLHFEQMAPLSKVYFAGELPLEKYTRYMRIGIK